MAKENELDKAKQAYATSKPEQQKLLEEIFGKQAFIPDVTERITTVEAAFSDRKISYEDTRLDLSKVPERFRKSTQAHLDLMIVTEALNQLTPEEWIDYTNSNQYKYSPYPGVKADTKRKTGFGFSVSYYGSSDARTLVGSRLCSPESRISIHSIEKFAQLHIDHKLT